MSIYMDASRAGLTPIYMVASRAGLTPIPICTLAMLGMSKAQRCSFTSLVLVFPAAATLGLKQARRQRLAISTLSLRGLISTSLSTYFSNLGPCYMLLDGIRAGRLVKL